MVGSFLVVLFLRNGNVGIFGLGRMFADLLMRNAIENRLVYEEFERHANEIAPMPSLRFRRTCGFGLPLRQTGSFPILYAGNGRRMLSRCRRFPGVQYPRVSANGHMLGFARSVFRGFALWRQRTNRLQHYENVVVYRIELRLARMMCLWERRLFRQHDAFGHYVRRIRILLRFAFVPRHVYQGRLRTVRRMRVPRLEQQPRARENPMGGRKRFFFPQGSRSRIRLVNRLGRPGLNQLHAGFPQLHSPLLKSGMRPKGFRI